MNNVSKDTIIRTAVLVIALLNTVLNALGKNPFPFSEDEAYESLSALFTVIAALVAWWKNNSFTKAARQADDVMKVMKAEGNTENENAAEV